MIGWKPNLLWFVCFIFTTQNASALQGSSVTTSCPLASLQELMKQRDSFMTHFTLIILNSIFWDEKSQLTPLYLFCTFLLHPPSPPDDLHSAPMTWAQWTAWESGKQRSSGHRLSAVLRDYLLTPGGTSRNMEDQDDIILKQDRVSKDAGTRQVRLDWYQYHPEHFVHFLFGFLIIFIKPFFRFFSMQNIVKHMISKHFTMSLFSRWKKSKQR